MERKVLSMKKRSRYIYRIMLSDSFGGFQNAALTFSFRSAIAYCSDVRRISSSPVLCRILRHPLNDVGFFDYFDFKNVTPSGLNSYIKLSGYEKGKSCKNLERD